MRIRIEIQAEAPGRGASFPFTQRSCSEALERAERERAETLELPAPPMEGKRSEAFSRASVFERETVEHLRAHEYPRTIVWVCRTEEEAALLRQVYNYWFAEEKQERFV